jgi:hypothetical protein
MILHNYNESIVEDAALTWFGQLGYELHMASGDATQTWDYVFGLPPRISICSSLNLDLSSPNLSSSPSVLPSNSYDLKEAIP